MPGVTTHVATSRLVLDRTSATYGTSSGLCLHVCLLHVCRLAMWTLVSLRVIQAVSELLLLLGLMQHRSSNMIRERTRDRELSLDKKTQTS